ncbi:family 20 glycosylhydrolase [Microbacterium gorillae]|uniref:family 20 glycosylhydrolase n=1 Tax=Microbacterium gorillae TaxID=1231063 RepID=UPI003D960F0D
MSIGVAPLPLIPYPTSVSAAPPVRLTEATRVVTGEVTRGEAFLLAAAVAERTGLGMELVIGVSPEPGDIVLALGEGGSDEGYSLRTGDGVLIQAATPRGAFWGTQTLRQLIARDADGWFVRGADITDSPRFAYRGVMLDVARHFFSVAEVCRFIDGISAYKINVLHLHLTDDQGWRIEIDGWPKLTELGGRTAALGDEGGYYTAEDYAEIIAYAAARHMTVVPEIDTPGHTHAITVAYPEFTEQPVMNEHLEADAARLNQALPVFGEPYLSWGVGFSSVKVGDPATDAFITDVFTQVAAMTPGPWVHLGGDECLGTDPADFATFVGMASAAIAATGKTPVAWHEAGRSGALAPGTVGQYWGFRTPQPGVADAARTFVEGGGALIISPADAAYLDMKYDDSTELGLAWADGPTSVEESYAWDPAAVVPGVDESQILGIEAPLWAESIRTPADIDYMTYPRLPGLAEIGWSAADGPERTWASLRERVAQQAPAWQADGIGYYRSPEIDWPQA